MSHHRRHARWDTNPAADRDEGRLEPESDFLRDLDRALADDHPLGLLELVSALLSVVDPRAVNPFDRLSQRRAGPSHDELVRTFLEVDRPEASALLSAIGVLSPDQMERRRIARTVEGRAHPLPAWIAGADKTEAYRTVEMTHVLGDGDNVMVGARFASGHELTAVVYIDHNVGTLVKDAFVVPQAIDELVDLMRATADDPDAVFADLPGGDAKARIVEAIARAAITIPPYETETWPACRPLVEWLASLLPVGGRGYERPEWTDEDQRDLTMHFWRSPFATGLDDREHRDLLETILWFGCDYGPGDPMRWSPVAVEMLLADWIPRQIVADADYLTRAPELLRRFVRFCHAERNIPVHLTDETLAALDQWEPGYQAAIRSPRPQGPEALLVAVGALDPDGPWSMPDDDEAWDYEALVLERLQRAVGGPKALDALDDAPLPDEQFDWSGIADDVHDRVAEVLTLCDRCCDELFDSEHRTASRRVLARIARRGPEVFRRRGRAETAAAAICWSVMVANDLVASRRGITQKALLAHFGIRQGSISPRAGTLLDAGGFPRHHDDFALGSPDYLVSSTRREILDTRHRLSSD